MSRNLSSMMVLLWLLGSACSSTYDPPSLINKLRVIGVRAEPPVVSITGKTKLEPLVVGYDTNEPLCYAWSLCLFALSADGNFACVDPDLETPLGTSPTAELSGGDVLALLPKIAEVFEKLGLEPPDDAGANPAQPDDDTPLEVYVRFKVAEAGTTAGSCPQDPRAWLAEPCKDRARCLAGYKRLAFATDPTKVHSNPVLQGLEVQGVSWPASVTPAIPQYKGDKKFGQLGAGAYTVVPRWDPESKELIGDNPDPSKPDPVLETMLFSWFSTAGDFDKQRSYDEVPENAFLPPQYKGVSSRLVTIWLVMRDGRNGTTWTSRQVEVRSDAPYGGNPLCRADPTLPGCQSP